MDYKSLLLKILGLRPDASDTVIALTADLERGIASGIRVPVICLSAKAGKIEASQDQAQAEVNRMLGITDEQFARHN